MTGSTGRRAECWLQEQWRHDGVGIPPIRLRLDLWVQVEQVLAEFLRIGSEVRAVGTRFAFRHLGLLPRDRFGSKPLSLVSLPHYC
jgi:hypothetical protein